MSDTLDKLQQLKATEFHALCDELLPRIDSRYHPIVPHGRNEAGDSIKGQPDSYIGNSAATCEIAIQHTVQKTSWWSKAIEDVEDARKACPNASEIVLLLPRDVDHEAPTKGDGKNWLQNATRKASPATLTVVHARKIAVQLDNICQDIRLRHLGIPYSRLSWHSIIQATESENTCVIDRLKLLNRYSPATYVDREADERFFRLWQTGLRNARRGLDSARGQRLVPLIADSGIGKTSLLARFVDCKSQISPVLLVLARDLDLQGEDSLVRYVIDKLQGSLNSHARTVEEAHLAKLLNGKGPLTVLIDGLDESTEPQRMRAAISFWLASRLGQESVLVVTSRPEFWRRSQDVTWASSVLRDSEERKTAKLLRAEQSISDVNPMQGIDLPGRFSKSELFDAWKRAVQNEDAFWLLNSETQECLRHPFTFMSAVSLLNDGVSLEMLGSKSKIIEAWIHKRFEKETDRIRRIGPTQLRDSLVEIARLANREGGGWVPIDKLDKVPRFDAIAPPGPVVEKLIESNLLESHPSDPGKLRFAFETVHDYFAAELILEEIKNSPKEVAIQVSHETFSVSVDKLERLGCQIHQIKNRDEFMLELTRLDPLQAFVVFRQSPNIYSRACVNTVVKNLGELLSSKFLSDQQLATQLLGRTKIPECEELIKRRFAKNSLPKKLHAVVSMAAISHGIIELVPTVFQTWWFIRDDYFIDLRPELLASTNDFQSAMATHASQYIPSVEHDDNYRRAITVLAYLKDERAVTAIEARTRSTIPYFYESLCLLAIGTPAAIDIYSRFVDLASKHTRDSETEAREKWWREVIVTGCGIANFATSELEDFVIQLLQSEDKEKQLIGRSLADKVRTERVLQAKVKRWHVEGYMTLPHHHDFGRSLGRDAWIRMWNGDPTPDVKQVLAEIAKDIPDPRVEAALFQGIEDPSIAGTCATSLASIGSERAIGRIRRLLDESKENERGRNWDGYAAVLALSRLRDPSSVKSIVQFIERDNGWASVQALDGLAAIGTDEAENAILNMSSRSDEAIVHALAAFGTRKCLAKAIEIAKQKVEAREWLVKQTRFSFNGLFGYRHGHYRVDVDIDEYLEFVLNGELTKELAEGLSSVFNRVDSNAVRHILRAWYGFRGTVSDIEIMPKIKLSASAFRDLADRGDAFVLCDYLAREIQDYKGFEIHDHVIERLSVFNRQATLCELRKYVESQSIDEKSLRVVVELLGFLGNKSDLDSLISLSKASSERIANSAYNSWLRLHDPMRLTESWS